MFVAMYLMLTLAGYSTCQRRIVDGDRVNKSYSYVVYIVWNEEKNMTSDDDYRDYNTVCGGVLITDKYVLTSAMCLWMYDNQSVIAGYNRYVPHGKGRNEEEEKCMELAKIPIIERNYNAEENRVRPYYENWYNMDMGVGTLERSYDFVDDNFESICSYKPTAALLLKKHIIYYYDSEMLSNEQSSFRKTETSSRFPPYENVEPKINDNVLLLGWGSSKYQVPENCSGDNNEEYLTSTSTVVMDDTECAAIYNSSGELTMMSEWKNRFCTNGPSNLDAEGNYKGLSRRHGLNNGTEDQCLFVLNMKNVYNNSKETCLNTFRRNFRRLGACQNDHGGPVVKFIDGKEYVVGVITAYMVNGELECVGPTVSTRYYKTSGFEFLENFIPMYYSDEIFHS